ncbi:MAG: hypothetical protein DI626_03640 [Micavibrio aeruginosavorus]|uniref:OmpA-like domain-containing protein n=1 Tax=Micavibrio aeruginosavorus TaxID=349221 RepID=A0A2W5A561_9BACT|nr:MAG: hypothetical protein DI626_03640 [Micavibrio aeruginosavorus]
MLVMASVSVLAGCSTVGGWTESENKAPKSEPVTITNKAAAPASVYPVPSDRELQSMTTKLSGGSVEVFDLDAPAPMDGNSVPSVSRDYAGSGVAYASDSSVTVYPLDGDMSTGLGAVGASDSAYFPLTPSPSAAGGTSGDAAAPRVGGGVSSVYFSHGSSQLGSGDVNALRSVAETAKFAPVDRVSVEGHASTRVEASDPVEARIINLRQSLKRAEKVSEALIEQGVPAEKIKTVGWGDTAPGGGGEDQQRRVDIVTGGGY